MKCYLCGHKEHGLITSKIRYDHPKKAFKCNNCGLVFLHPQMTEEEERIFYEREYGEIYSKEKGTSLKDLFNARLQDAKTYYELVKEYLNKDNDCLEIGCASGYFLATIKDKVKSVTGFETYLEFKKFCKSINIKMLENLEDCSDGRFDRIFMFFVLEHLRDPINYLKRLKKILMKGGCLLIEVPNVDDVLISVYKIPKFLNFYFTPAHQFYYSKETLSALLQKAGFQEFEIKSVQRYDLSNHIHWMLAGKPGGMGLYNHIFSQTLLDAYADDLRKHLICDTLFAIVKQAID